jgi:hypothetical protein
VDVHAEAKRRIATRPARKAAAGGVGSGIIQPL